MLNIKRYCIVIILLLSSQALRAQEPPTQTWADYLWSFIAPTQLPNLPVKIDPDVGDPLKKIPGALDNTTNSVNNSILNKDNAAAALKTLSYATIGTIVASYGIKICYDSIVQITEKFNDEENARTPWRKVLSRGDYLSMLAGLGVVSCGVWIIARSNQL